MRITWTTWTAYLGPRGDNGVDLVGSCVPVLLYEHRPVALLRISIKKFKQTTDGHSDATANLDEDDLL